MVRWPGGRKGGEAKGAQTLPKFGTTKRRVFSTNAQSKLASVLVDAALGLPGLAWHTSQCPFISVAPKATGKARRGPLKGAVSAQKDLSGSETEMRE